MTEILLVLIWVKTVCKGYQKTTKIPASKDRVKSEVGIKIIKIWCDFRDDSSTVVMSDTPRPASMVDESPPPAVSITR